MKFRIPISSNNKELSGITSSSKRINSKQVTGLSYLILNSKFLNEISIPIGYYCMR
jgi:hypothetical protein